MIILDEYLNKVKSWYKISRNDLYIAGVIFLVGMAGFGLGRLSMLWPQKESIRIQEPQNFSNTPALVNNFADKSESAVKPKGKYVASKSGTSYHYPWCTGALKIKEENKIWFQTKEEAEGKGYKPAGNCEGL